MRNKLENLLRRRKIPNQCEQLLLVSKAETWLYDRQQHRAQYFSEILSKYRKFGMLIVQLSHHGFS
jgi:hypothetical protein